MVEEMYQQEAKEAAAGDADDNPDDQSTTATPPGTAAATDHQDQQQRDHITPAQTPMHHTLPATTTANVTPLPPSDNDPANYNVNRHGGGMPDAVDQAFETCRPGSADVESRLIRFGTSTGDVSLTLGLRQNLPEKGPFSVRDFGSRVLD